MSEEPRIVDPNAPGEKGWLERKENVTRIAWALYAVCAVLVLLDFVIHRHAEMGADGFYGFYAIYGFVGSVGLVLVAKHVLRPLVMRSEDYYDD